MEKIILDIINGVLSNNDLMILLMTGLILFILYTFFKHNKNDNKSCNKNIPQEIIIEDVVRNELEPIKKQLKRLENKIEILELQIIEKDERIQNLENK